MKRLLLTILVACLASTARAQTSPLAPGLAGLSFLVGVWSDGNGRVAERGGTSTGTSVITAEAGGGALLRRDHTSLQDASGRPAGGFDQIMLIYPEGGGLRADYADGSHVIHYVSAEVQPGRSVVFASAARPGAPVFRLRYELAGPGTLAVSFAIAAPGASDFRPIATGTLTRSR